MKLSDYVWSRLADLGVRHAFVITGGGAMHLNDSLGRERRIQYVCNHHEQACAMAAEAYARVAGSPAAVNVTTGPGGINALNGVFGAFTDSIPMVVVSGQVKRETCKVHQNLGTLRQLGDQEADIVAMVRDITKYAVLVSDPKTIRYHIERAWHLAVSGRPGPCWIDIPVDVQGSTVDEDKLPPYDAGQDPPPWDVSKLPSLARETAERLACSPRPVLMAGTGVRLAGAVDIFERVIRRLGIPVATAWTAHDLLASDDALHCGRPGSVGDRAGNFTVQNAETLLVIGSRLNIRQVSYGWASFARAAFKIQVDADEAELAKPTVKPDLPVHSDARLFLEELDRQLNAAGYDPRRHEGWLAWCRARVARYPVLLPRHRRVQGAANPYHFVSEVFERLDAGDVIVCGDGAACVVPFQVGRIRKGQRMFCNSGCASMGYDLPAAVGAAVAREGRRRVICLAGDGSVMLNIQELQTVVHHRLPVKLFILNNGGYLSIRQTQASFFGRLMGTDPSSGVSFPDFVKLGEAFGIPSRRVDACGLEAALDEVLGSEGPALCEVVLDSGQGFEPKLTSRTLPDGRIVSSPLEDLSPFLDRDELAENMVIPPWEGQG